MQHLLANCRNVKSLELLDPYRNVVDDKVGKLIGKYYRALEYLELRQCNITGVSVQCIAEGCPNLTKLSLRGCYNFTDDAIRVLTQKCHKITVLDLSGTKITNASLDYIVEGCPAIEVLYLEWCSITDDGLEYLAKQCSTLNTVHLADLDQTDSNRKSPTYTEVGVKALSSKCSVLLKKHCVMYQRGFNCDPPM